MRRRLLLSAIGFALCVVLTTGCFDSSSASSPPSPSSSSPAAVKGTLRVQIRESRSSGFKTIHTTTLHCDANVDPASKPGKACAAIADYAAHFRGPKAACSPTVGLVGSRYADVSGTVNGKHVSAEFRPVEMCYVPKRFINDLYNATNLRAFNQPGTPNGIS